VTAWAGHSGQTEQMLPQGVLLFASVVDLVELCVKHKVFDVPLCAFIRDFVTSEIIT